METKDEMLAQQPTELAKRAVPIPAGSLVIVTSGEYSDFSIDGLFRATREIPAETLLQEWLRQHPEQGKEYEFKRGEFFAWIFASGALEAVPAWELWLGDYGKATARAEPLIID